MNVGSIIICIIYFAILIGIAVIASKKSKNAQEFTNAGRRIAMFAAMCTIIASEWGSGNVIGTASDAYSYGISAYIFPVAMGIGIERINGIAAALQQEIREKYDEPDALVQAFDVDALGGNSLTTAATADVISLLCAAPNGVQSYSADIPGLVQTSLNLGVCHLGDQFTATFSVRSSVNREKEELLQQLRDLTAFYKGTYSQAGTYPAWEYRKDSPLRDTMVRVYQQMFGKDPQVLAIHAGLECGLLGDKLPGLDCVSIGPQMHDIHTSRERLDIASTERTWKFLLEVLKAL